MVFSSLLPDTNQKRHQRTRVVKKTTNPEFNHTMVFDGLRPEDLSETCVELTVWDHDRLSNHFIGGTRLGLGTGLRHVFMISSIILMTLQQQCNVNLEWTSTNQEDGSSSTSVLIFFLMQVRVMTLW